MDNIRSILAHIRAMLEDVPLGNKRLEIGLTLREAWFINGTLYNSEVWCSYKTEDLKVLEVLDRKILREITGAHSKAPWEMLYLETATLPISSVIIARRLNYLQTILKRNNEEVIWKVYTAQKSAPTKGDWTNLVQEDMGKIELEISDEAIAGISDEDYKDLVRSKVRLNALNELKIRQKGHNKVKHIPFVHLQAPQEYLTSTLFNNKMKKILFNLRCKTLKTIRDNFHKFYHNDIKCKLCGTGEIDSQEHLLKCHNVTSKLSPDMLSLWKTVKYEDIFGSPQEQQAVTRVFQSLFKIRLRLLRDM